MNEHIEQINNLRKFEKHATPEDMEWLDHLEEQVKKADQYKNFLDHPVTRMIVESITRWITEANQTLLTGTGDQKTVIRRDDLLDILNLFSPSRAKAPQGVDQLEGKIAEFRKYYRE